VKSKKLLIVAGVVFLSLIVAALPFMGACAPAPAPAPPEEAPPVVPPSEQPLKIGSSLCITGVAAEKGSPYAHGQFACIKYINGELGGVDGHPIELHWYDDAYDAAKEPVIVKKLMEEGCLFYTVCSSKMMSSGMEIANRAGFPGLAGYSSPACIHPPKHIYAQQPDYGDDWAAFAKYYLENIWEGEGKPKMALHLLNNPTGFGVRDAARALADELGIEIVASEEHTATTISEMETMTRIKGLEPDVLFISSTPAPTAVVIKNAYELGIYPGITIGCAHASFTKALVDIAGADIVEGVYGVFPTVGWGDDVPGMDKMVEYCNRHSPRDKGTMEFLIGWANGLALAEIARVALENCGYDVLAKGDATTWQCVEEKGFRNVKGYDVEGLQGPIDFSDPEDHRGSKSVKVYQVINGKVTAVTDWVEAPLIKFEEFEWFR